MTDEKLTDELPEWTKDMIIDWLREMGRICKKCAYHNPNFINKICLQCSLSEFDGKPSNFKPKEDNS